MNLPPDYLIERKRSKLQLTKWKIVSLILLIALLVIFGQKKFPNDYFSSSYKNISAKSEYIASISFEEIIYDNLARLKKINKLAEDESIKAVIVNINSPGGSVVGSESLYNALRKIAQKKPVVAVMHSVAASGGYLVSLGADYIIAHNGTITGSIGVLMQTAEITELAEKIGIKFNNFKSNELKANPGFTEKLTDEAEEAMMENIFDVYDYFVQLISERRGLNVDYVKKIADGRIYSSKIALKYNLIDAIGNEDTAIKWLEEEQEITKNLKIVEVKLTPQDKLMELLLDDLGNNIRYFGNKLLGSFHGLSSRI